MKKKGILWSVILLAVMAAVLAVTLSKCRGRLAAGKSETAELHDTIYPLGFLTDTLEMKSGRVRGGENFMGLLMRLGLSGKEAWALSQSCPDSLFDVRKMRAGNEYDAYYLKEKSQEGGAETETEAASNPESNIASNPGSNTGAHPGGKTSSKGKAENDGRKHLHYLVYHNNRLESTVFALKDSTRIYKVYKEIRYEDARADVTINSSLWNDMQAAGAPVQLILDLSDIYAWTVDFFGLQKGDRFQVLYRKKLCEDSVIGIDAIRYAIFTHRGTDYECVMFNPAEYVQQARQQPSQAQPTDNPDAGSGEATNWDKLLAGVGSNVYWNEKGESMRKTFLKAPLHYSRVSSGFSYARKHPVTRKVQPHTGVDYAAPTGTPVMTIGDGTVLSVKYEGAGGNTVRIRHNSIYTTAYLHLSKYGKGITPGARVSQGQVIGYVGATGRCTGPHLDFRIWKNGSPINPLTMDSPPSAPLPEAFMPAFDALRASLRDAWGKSRQRVEESGL